MFLIYFLSKVLTIGTLLIIVLTSVSTKTKLYQMVQKKEDYVSYLSRPMDPTEIKMRINDFHLTKYNFDHIILPRPFKSYDYHSYKRRLSNYCPKTYLTYDLFLRHHHITLFENAVMDLTKCLKNTNEQFVEEIKLAFGIEPAPEEFTLTFMHNINRLKTCIAKMYVRATKNNNDYSYATSDSDDTDDRIYGCFDYNYRENSKDVRNYANYILQNIKDTLSAKHRLHLHLCLSTFKKKFNRILPNIIPGNTGWLQNPPTDDPTVKELLLARSIILKMRDISQVIDIQNMFHVMFQLKEMKLTNNEFKDCELKLKVMDLVHYTSTKLSYLLLPPYPVEDSDKTFSEYEERRLSIIKNLMAIDFKNEPYYTKLLNMNEQFNRNDFSKLIRRRAINFETNYDSYAMRIMYLNGYYPLPRHLWVYERKHSDDKELQEFILKEQKSDLESYMSHINQKYNIFLNINENVPSESIQE